jgi:hypothetical protein
MEVGELTKRWQATGIADVKVYTPKYHVASFFGPLWIENLTTDAYKLYRERL